MSDYLVDDFKNLVPYSDDVTIDYRWKLRMVSSVQSSNHVDIYLYDDDYLYPACLAMFSCVYNGFFSVYLNNPETLSYPYAFRVLGAGKMGFIITTNNNSKNWQFMMGGSEFSLQLTGFSGDGTNAYYAVAYQMRYFRS